MTTSEILKRLEDHKGRKIDFSSRRDVQRLFMSIDTELRKRDSIISNIKNVLNGQQTYDQTQYKTILDSNRKQN